MTKELRRIALIEDDDDIAVLTAMALTQIGGYEVIHYPSGPEALEKIPRALPDLIILDYSMPHMNGDEVLVALRGEPATAAIPAIFMTASVMPDHVKRLRAIGAIEVFAKPFDPIALPERVRSAWAKAIA